MTLAADRIQIQQVIINLLRNACDAVLGSPVKKVKIMATAHIDEKIVCVADTGPGVSLEAAQNIFSWSDSTKEGGMGLGLSISRTIIEGHRGRIWLERSAGTGSELCFSIPVTAARAGVGTDEALIAEIS
jgi:two-component system, LuxR family, sensor kinase FixL